MPAGTAVLTPAGERPFETLALGDRIITLGTAVLRSISRHQITCLAVRFSCCQERRMRAVILPCREPVLVRNRRNLASRTKPRPPHPLAMLTPTVDRVDDVRAHGLGHLDVTVLRWRFARDQIIHASGLELLASDD
ncbi:Hint domain-containing protein [Pseudooceanicola algae]|uniref:hypothetical protein n=1 Tax=Pseudooceanicola algae TaxID=1537215 RepID=UPI000E6D1C07|nr:hypothetical protein [Pseudooceanicola algae]